MITVLQTSQTINLQQGLDQTVIEQEQTGVTVAQDMSEITVEQQLPDQIIIQGGSILATILPFSVTATTNGQTVFILPYAFTSIICLFIMGTGQDPIAGDYTVNGNVVTLGSSTPTIQAGDLIFGSGQI